MVDDDQGAAAELASVLGSQLRAAPPVIGGGGLSGAGTSTTFTALFRTTLVTVGRVGRAAVGVPVRRGPVAGTTVPLRVLDIPSLGVDDASDARVLDTYRRLLPACDVVVWVLAARSGALALDLRYLAQLAPLVDRVVVGLNQVDIVEPRDWNTRFNVPSDRQATRIGDLVAHRSAALSAHLGRPVAVEPYSAVTGFNLHGLFAAILEALPPARRWVYSALRRDLDPLARIDPELAARVRAAAGAREAP